MKLHFLIILLSSVLIVVRNCPSQCSLCNLETKICLKCFQNFQLDQLSNTCLPNFDQQSTHSPNQKLSQQNFKKLIVLADNTKSNLNKFYKKDSSREARQIRLQSSRLLQSVSNCLFTDSNNASICQLCQDGFILNGISCQSTPKNCLEFDLSKKQCTKCKGDLYLELNKCINVHCLLYEYGTQKCLQCEEEYEFDLTLDCIKSKPKNCANMTKGQCSVCNQGFYLNIGKNCEILPFKCISFDSVFNKCTKCGQNYTLTSDGKCEQQQVDQNCKKFNEGKCIQCSFRYYLSSSQKCISVSPLCKDYSLFGKCTDCYPGYTLNIEAGACIVSSLFSCKKQNSLGTCIECSQGSFLNSLGQCQTVNPLCRTYDQKSGNCLTCYQGYTLLNGLCQMFVEDPNCKKLSNQTQKCVECIPRYFINGSKCSMVNALCKGFSQQTGECTDCYQGYGLVKGECKMDTRKAIQNCKIQQNSVCVVCADFYYFNSVGKCIEVNPLCKTYNNTNGFCTSCYSGYEVSGGSCVIAKVETNLNCLEVLNSTDCKVCVQGYVLKSGKCEKSGVYKNCKTLNSVNGYCLSCYNGYILSSNNCLLLSEVILNMQKTSVEGSGQLLTNIQTNQSTSKTIPGKQTTNNAFTNQQSLLLTAIPSASITASAQENCIHYQNQLCTECKEGYFLNSNFKCIYFNPLCSSLNLTNGNCLSCLKGYHLTLQNDCQPDSLQVNYPPSSTQSLNCMNPNNYSIINIETKTVEMCPRNTQFNFTLKTNQQFILPTNSSTVRFPFANKTEILLIENISQSSFLSAEYLWHYPSQHKINGITTDLELQIIHQKHNSTQIAVLSLLFKTGTDIQQDGFKDGFFNINSYEISDIKGSNKLNRQLMFYYKEQTAVPPCQQSVSWFVHMQPLPITLQTLNKIKTSFNSFFNKKNDQSQNNKKVSLVGGACNLFGTSL